MAHEMGFKDEITQTDNARPTILLIAVPDFSAISSFALVKQAGYCTTTTLPGRFQWSLFRPGNAIEFESGTLVYSLP